MPKHIEDKLEDTFKGKVYVTREELLDFFHVFEPDLHEGTFGWRIHDLKNKNIIKPVKKGLYTLTRKPKYKPGVSTEALKLARYITNQFENLKYCIWETAWLNEFSRHQASKKMILIEVEKEFVESLYFGLKDHFRFDFFINPDEKEIRFYISESFQPVVIKKLIKRSPVSKRTEKKITFYTPLLEKILVDFFAEEKLFYFYQGAELANIYENALSSYAVNFTKLLSYAGRREKKHEIKEFLMEHMPHLAKDMLDD